MPHQAKVDHALHRQIESHVRRSTYGRIRNLSVEWVAGQYLVKGHVPSHHTKQLALHGALELLSSDRFADGITVGALGGLADVSGEVAAVAN